ncbi:MAG: nuclear transport factor 2 family protein [Actinomycetota bacterium]
MNTKLDNARGLYTMGIIDGRPEEAMATFTGARYDQHSTGVPDQQDGFIAFFTEFLERNPKRDIEIKRGLVDGNFVFLHVHQNLNDGEAQWVTMDILETDDDDKMVEHWDVIAAYNETNPSGRSNIDGPTEVTDLDKTDENKALVRELMTELLMRGGDLSKLDQFIAEDYIQHNPDAPDGRATFQALLESPDRPLWYDEIVLLVGEGNFVATLSRAHWEEVEYAQMDLFRIEDGLVVEHWDAAEPVPTGPQPNRGKF